MRCCKILHYFGKHLPVLQNLKMCECCRAAGDGVQEQPSLCWFFDGVSQCVGAAGQLYTELEGSHYFASTWVAPHKGSHFFAGTLAVPQKCLSAAGRLCTELEGSQVLWGVVQGSPQDWQRTAWHQPDSRGAPTPSPHSMAALQRMGGSGPLTPTPVQLPSTALHTSLRCALHLFYDSFALYTCSFSGSNALR